LLQHRDNILHQCRGWAHTNKEVERLLPQLQSLLDQQTLADGSRPALPLARSVEAGAVTAAAAAASKPTRRRSAAAAAAASVSPVIAEDEEPSDLDVDPDAGAADHDAEIDHADF